MNAFCPLFNLSMMCSTLVVCNNMWWSIVCVFVSGRGTKNTWSTVWVRKRFFHCFSSLFHFVATLRAQSNLENTTIVPKLLRKL